MFLLLFAFCPLLVYSLGAGFDPGLTNFGAMLWKGFLVSTISYFSLSLGSSFSGWVIVDPDPVEGFFVTLVVAVLLSLYLSSVDLDVP